MLNFSHEDIHFHYRVAGVALTREQVLTCRSENDVYFSLPGNLGEILEPSKDSLQQNLNRVLQVQTLVGRMVWVVEHFFQRGNQKVHELCFYYLVHFDEASGIYQRHRPFWGMTNEDEDRLSFEWKPLHDLANLDLRPQFLKEALKNVPEQTTHHVSIEI